MRINFHSTERLKPRTMLIIITKKGHYAFLEFSWSAAISVSSSLARPLLSLPNYSFLSTRELPSLFLNLQHYTLFSPLRNSHVGVARPLHDSTL